MTDPRLRPADLHAALLAADSATAVLAQMFGGPVRVRRRLPDVSAGDGRPAELMAAADEAVTWRRVHLLGRGRPLSDADLWYVAARLPPGLARRLKGSAQPFGRVVRGLGLRRTTLSSRLCRPGEPFALEHRALLSVPGGRPVAVVQERYVWSLFGAS